MTLSKQVRDFKHEVLGTLFSH